MRPPSREPCLFRALGTSLGVAFILVIMFTFLLPSKFLTNKFYLSHDTITYTTEQGLSNGFGLGNFASSLRLPGYPLFFLLTTLGKLPHPGAIAQTLCGTSVWGANGSCEAAALKLHSDVTVQMDPVVYGYSAATALLFQRTIEISRGLFVLSIVMLFVAISRRLATIPSAISVLVIVYFLFFYEFNPSMDTLETESLFPAITLFYLSAFLQYLRSRHIVWLGIATALIVYAFFVRPAYLYMPVLHFIATTFAAISYKKWQPFALSAAVIVPAFVWCFLYSPIQFFSLASHNAALLRTAVLADPSTVDCVADPAQRSLLEALVNSNNDALKSVMKYPASANYVERYYALARGNLYRIDLKAHPIYRQPGIDRILWNGSIPDGLISGMLASAGQCDRLRNFVYSALNFAMMTGLTPVLVPAAQHFFFQSPCIFWISATCILLVIVWSFAARDGWWLFLSAMPSALYFGTIVVVAFEQGGEARYSFVVEPLYVLSALTCFFFVIGETISTIQKRWPNELLALAGRAFMVNSFNGNAEFVRRYRSKLTLLIAVSMLSIICGYYLLLLPLFGLASAAPNVG